MHDTDKAARAARAAKIHAAAVELGRRGGLAGKGKTSEKKAKAARANGLKGGRPPRIPLIDRYGVLIGWGARKDGKPEKDREIVRWINGKRIVVGLKPTGSPS